MNYLTFNRIKGICSAVILLVLLLSSIDIASAAVVITSIIYPISCVLCRILQILWGITAGITTMVIVLAGLKWIGSMEDPGSRAVAKSSIVHAIVGLILVTIAMQIVAWMVQGTVVGSVAGYTFDPADWLPTANCALFC